MNAVLQDRLRALIKQHCETLKSEATDISTALERWSGDEVPDAALLSNARGAAHKLKGSSGTIGFAGISRRAAKLETMLNTAAEAPDATQRAPILACSRDLLEAVAKLRPEESSLYDRAH